jgi:uncharacterized protein YktB (UPF0637 family)
MAKKEEVLQKVTEYCNERQYTSTLDEAFVDKFSDKFAKANADANIDDIVGNIKFNIDTAFSAASKGIEKQSATWKAKESEYQKLIDEYKKSQDVTPAVQSKDAIVPDEIKQQLEEFKKFKEQAQRQEKIANVFNLAKAGVREDLHDDLKNVLDIMTIDYTKSDSEIAQELSNNFTKLNKDRIGDIKPLASSKVQKDFDELLKNVPKVKVF